MRMKRSARKLIGATGLALALSGCTTLSGLTQAPKVPDNVRAIHSTGLPNAVVTNFNEALACMDDLMLVNQVSPIYLASPTINNFTSDRSLSAGATEMLITALAKMAIRSGGVRYVSFGPDVQNMLTLQGAHPNNKDFRVPDFFVRGGVTQFNKSFWNGQRGSGVSAKIDPGQLIHGGTFFILRDQEDATYSISQDRAFGTLTMDLNAGFIANLQMIPGIASSNTLALENRAGKATTGDLTVAGLGLSYSFSENVSHDFNHVLRSLVEVGAIEIVGKLQGIPYWRCLANAGSVEQRDRELREKFAQQSASDSPALVRSAQQALKDMKYYAGDANGVIDAATQEGLQEYQRQMGLLSTGLLNFETFRMLNIYTPARPGPYVHWWQNVNGSDRIVAPRVPAKPTPPANPAAAPAAKPTAAEPAKPAADNKAAEPAKPAAAAEAKPAAPTVVAAAAAAEKPAVEARASEPAKAREGGTENLVLSAPTTLRKLSRSYFPDETGTYRSRLIRRIAAANPKLFPDVEEAFDQALPAGQSLRIPAGLLPARAAESN